MEEGQRRRTIIDVNGVPSVLILVVMEEGQRPAQRYSALPFQVLILVVMEEGQRRVRLLPRT